ncbi:MAG: acyl-CoA dehydrogenase family protein, partial [Actinobacteria bacterium]|nr:acyl-CoA dehydrogenase family protein [Actinomycetota bacterium]
MNPEQILETLPPHATHQVLNQSGRTPDHDAYSADVTLRGVTDRYDLGWAEERFRRLGEVAGSQRVEDLARQANRHDPELVPFDRYGHRVDAVEFHPAYHELMRLAYGHEVHSLAWTGDGPHPHTARAVLSYLWNQAENGVGCPTGMTYASVDTLRKAPHLRDPWIGKALSTAYDPRPVHAAGKTGITLGMAMTEKQGGSDLKKVRTLARPLDGSNEPGARFALTGHKWFTSVPMSDAFLAVARTDAGVSCFFFERWHEDGSRNGMRIQRLKDKAGNRS